MTQSQEKLIKIILLGSSGIGKTSILQKYFDNKFIQNPLYTIGIDFRTKFLNLMILKLKLII